MLTVVSVNLSAPKRSEKFRDPLCAQGPFRHYIINFLWIFVNIICIILTIYHLLKLHRDYTTPSADTVRVATLVTSIASADSNTSEVPYYDGILDKKFDISRHNLNPTIILLTLYFYCVLNSTCYSYQTWNFNNLFHVLNTQYEGEVKGYS